jgi:hypothetical protein
MGLAMLIQISLTDDLLLQNQTITMTIAAHDTFNLTINATTSFIYLEVDSCGTPSILLSKDNTFIAPSESLLPMSFLYPFDTTAELRINSSLVEK